MKFTSNTGAMPVTFHINLVCKVDSMVNLLTHPTL